MLDRNNLVRMVVTPDLAEKWLSVNEHNRPKKPDHVRNLARAMKDGRWVLNGETIKIAVDGRLIDGQHRLQACVDSGMPFETFIIFGLPFEVFRTVDDGRKRTAADTLAIDHVKNSAAAAGAARWLVNIRSGGWNISSVKLTTDEIVNVITNSPGFDESIAAVLPCRNIIASALAGALHYLFSEKSRAEANCFFADLASGADLASTDAVFVLREWLLKDRLAKAKLTKEEICVMTIRAWVHRRTAGNAPMKQLKGTIQKNDNSKKSYPDIV